MIDPRPVSDRYKFLRFIVYWFARLLRRFSIGELFYDCSVSAFDRKHEQIPPLFPGDSARGGEILIDKFTIPGRETTLAFWTTLERKPDVRMRRLGISSRAIRHINQFSWLADLHAFSRAEIPRSENNDRLDLEATPSIDPQDVGMKITVRWIRNHPRWSALTWHVPTLSRRINHWLYAYQHFFGTRANIDFDRVFFESISKQLSHLRISVLFETQGFERILGLICWVNCSLCLSQEERRRNEGVHLLSIELQQLFTKPHTELVAAPLLTWETYRELQRICQGFVRQKLSVPPSLQYGRQCLEFLLAQAYLPNNTFAHFHGTWDMPADWITFPGCSAHSIARSRMQASLLRVQNEHFCVIMDSSSSPPRGTGHHMHQSALGLEIFDDQQGIITSVLPPADQFISEKTEYRGAEYHSLPMLENDTLAEFRADGSFGRRGYEVKSTLRHGEDDSGHSLDTIIASHDAYEKNLGARLKRTVDIGRDDRGIVQVQGSDVLMFSLEPRGRGSLRLVSLFHLYPGLKAKQLSGGGVMIFVDKGRAWRLEAHGEGATIQVIERFMSYLGGAESVGVQTLWMAREIVKPEHHGCYSNDWSLQRISK